MKTYKIGFSEIEDYLLGKLSPEEALLVEEAISSDAELAKMKEEIADGLKYAKDIDKLHLSEESSAALFKRIKQMAKKPEVKPGQVWELDTIGKVLITEIPKDKKVVRFVPLTDDLYFAFSTDLKFTDINISLRPLVAHTSIASVTNAKNLKVCYGKVSSEYLQAIKQIEKGKKIRLPKGMIAGRDDVYAGYLEWEEFIRTKLDTLYDDALISYSGEKSKIKVVAFLTEAIDMVKGIISRLEQLPGTDIVAEPQGNLVFNMAAKSNLNNKAVAYNSDNLIIEFEDLNNALGINFLFGNFAASHLDKLEIAANKKKVFVQKDIPVENNVAKVIIHDRALLNYLYSSDLIFRLSAPDGIQFNIRINNKTR